MVFLTAAVVGVLAGMVAKLLMPGQGPGGFMVSIALGMAGALLATWLAAAAGLEAGGGSAAVVGAAVGAWAVLLPFRLLPPKWRR